MALGVYVNYKGNASEAMAFYEKVFKCEPAKIMRFGDAPPMPGFDMPDAMKALVMHADLEIFGSHLLASDMPETMMYQQGNNMSLILTHDDVEAMTAAFEALAVGGTITMPLQETFWSKCYGMLIDPFGVQWQFSHESHA